MKTSGRSLPEAGLLSTRVWIGLIAAIALVSGIFSMQLLTGKRPGSVVEIRQGDVLLQEIDLSAVTKEYRFTVEAPEGGSNTILVQPGRICVTEADCPDHLCVSQGWLTDQAAPIVCLPHRLVIRVKDSSGPDAVAQ